MAAHTYPQHPSTPTRPVRAMTENLADAAVELAERGWPVFPCKPGAKTPLTKNGVKDATTDPRRILHWWDQWPTANLAVACGHPGPTVLDVDDPIRARPVLDRLEPVHAPTCATYRGRHLYFLGEARGTVSLGYGELRGRGSYVIAPPSTHPSGKLYVWLAEPNGRLPKVPELLTPETVRTAGVGAFEAPTEPVPHGARHDFLKGIAVRGLRAGITDVPTLILIIQAAYETHCVKTPRAKPNEFAALAEWAARTDIAARERAARDQPETTTDAEGEGGGKSGAKDGPLDRAPNANATLAEHRAYLRAAGGWGPRVDIHQVRRHGGRLTDPLEIHLTNGLTIRFPKQEQISTRGNTWARTVIAATNGIANPPGTFKDHQLQSVFRSLCILADAPPDLQDREDLSEAVGDFLALCEPLPGHDLTDTTGRYDATARCRARTPFDPRRNSEDTPSPALLIDNQQRRYIRAGELRDYLGFRGLGISSPDLPGRMLELGYTQMIVNGREEPRPDRPGPRRTNRMRLYQIPEDTPDD